MGLFTEGNLRLKIDWASPIVGSKFTVFALFYFVFEGNFPITSPRGAYIWRGDLTEGFLRYWFGRLIFGGAYFRNFTVLPKRVREDIAPHGRDINGNFVPPTILNQGPYLNPRTFQDNY